LSLVTPSPAWGVWASTCNNFDPTSPFGGNKPSFQVRGAAREKSHGTVARELPTRPHWWHIKGVKSLTEQLWFEVPGRRGFVNITNTVEELVRQSGVEEGLCLVNAMHITASVFINDAEDGLLHDYDVWLEKLAPHAPTAKYRHNLTGEDNADAHMKRQIMGREVVVAITKGKLDFGPWEQIFYGEFDGNRRKRVLVKIIGD
jgi:secondary thiamine-phosphate synthase enzyme